MPERRLLLPAVLVGLALGLTGCAGTDSAAAAGSGSPSASPSTSAPSTPLPAGQRIEVTVAGGSVSGDTGRIAVPAGAEVVLAITSDVADEVHVHGYDLTADLIPGRTAEIPFPAGIPGVFEVELHEAGTVLLSLQVG